MSQGDMIAMYSLIVSVAALLASLAAAIYAVRRSDKAASAGSLISLQIAFRDGWERYLQAADERRKDYYRAEVLNLLEIGCALYRNRSITGLARSLMKDYLISALRSLSDDPDARIAVREMLEFASTFEHVRWFESDQRSNLSFLNADLLS